MSELENDSKQARASLFNKTVKLFGIIMVFAYIAIGVAIMTNYGGIMNARTQFALPAGVLLILYGCFRGFRLYQQVFNDRP